MSEEKKEIPFEGDVLSLDEVKGLLIRSATEVPIQELAQKGHKVIRIVSSKKVMELINQAVQTIVLKYREDIVSKEKIAEESRKEFTELLAQYRQAVQTKTSLEESYKGLTTEMEELKEDLEQAKRVAEGRVSEEEQMKLIVSLKEFEYKLDAILAKSVDKKQKALQETDDKEGLAALEQAKQELTELLKEIYKSFIQETMREGKLFRDKYILLLERRIERLYSHIRVLEEAIKMLASQKIYSSTQLAFIFERLGITDPAELEKKLPILKAIVEENIRLRQKIKELGEIKKGES